ncbi:MAG: DUF58 domain-containing protein [Methylacidiphilales bacterium]|nr:DUF58 domain-containing protein [Candidatus Methylacidiphilales bacterium]
MEQTSSHRDLLDADAIARGETLGILARTVVEGYRVGEHRSPFRGFAIEFSQHREYTPGDDIRHLDWKVLGRTDRYYIKQYEQDTNFVAHLLIDGSSSMNYGSGKITKLHYAKALGACLAYLILLQRDAVALHVFDTELRETMTRTDNLEKIHSIMDRLAAFKATEQTRIGAALNDIARMTKARGIVMVISDLFDDEEALEKGIRQIRFGGSEVVVFHVMDPYELEFPFHGTVEFIGLEGTLRMKTTPAAIRKSYLKSMNDFRRRVHEICDRSGCHYILANTGLSLGEMLSGYLAFRHKVAAR